jgi:chemotaxis protein CheD
MLPYWNGQGLASPKYGNIAIEKLIDKMISLGCKKNNLQAKIFGGGEVIETNIVQFHIGERNTQIAREILIEKNIPIVAFSHGGKLGRKIEFYTSSGEVKQKYVQKMDKLITG